MSILSSLTGALAESWDEVRHHKLRVALSLAGIAVAVAALTAALALVEYQTQAQIEQSDRYGGRAATLTVTTYSTDGTPINFDEVDANFQQAAQRYDFSHTSRFTYEGALSIPVEFPEGTKPVPARLMDAQYPDMHRLTLTQGRWFHEADKSLLAPPIVISEALWEMTGAVPLDAHPTLTLGGELAGHYRIIGITPQNGNWDTTPRIDLLYDTYRGRVEAVVADLMLAHEIWLSDEQLSDIAPVLAMDLRAGAAQDHEIMVQRTDWGAWPDMNAGADLARLVAGAIAGIILLLGGLSLVNIQLVAMRQRIREIGVRRSFGASGARIFFSVMLENVVATLLAGVVGIMLVIIVLRSPWVVNQLVQNIQDVPPFPLGPALIGLAASVGIGALAGFVPALVALRVRVIDAIRF